MDLSRLSERERLVAEQAVVTLRALDEAADRAPWGRGMDSLEAAIHEQGFEHLRQMMTLAASARPEAQKKGSASGPAPAGKRRSSK